MASSRTPDFNLRKLVSRLTATTPSSHRRIAKEVRCGASTVRRYAGLIEQSGWNKKDLAPLDSDALSALLNGPAKVPIDFLQALAVLRRGGTVRMAWEEYRAGSHNPRETHFGYQAYARHVARRLRRKYEEAGDAG